MLFCKFSMRHLIMSSSGVMNLEELLEILSKTPSGTQKVRYFGVQIPGSPVDKSVVIHKLPTHSQFRLLCPNVRFKELPTAEEASLFSQNLLPVSIDRNFRKVIEPKSPYPSPTQVEKDLLLNAISKGDLDAIRKLVWKNPKLLITPDDFPQCYKGTWRQTLMHLTVIQCSFDVFCLLMEIVENPELARATQLTQFENLEERRAFIISNYLNNRTKKEESVLDLAVQFGMIEIVDFLTVHPYCQMGISNRSMKDIVCSRASQDRKKFGAEILSMLNDRWYVPLFVADEKGQKSFLGEPAPVEIIHKGLKEGKVVGLFGPSNLINCQKFVERYQTIKAIFRSSPLKESESKSKVSETVEPLKKSDGQAFSANERICRQVAKELKGQWKEWWSFLGAFINLSSRKGLSLLESYFGRWSFSDSQPSRVSASDSSAVIKENLQLVEICSLFYIQLSSPSTDSKFTEKDFDDDDDDELVFYTPPSSPETEESYCDKFFHRHVNGKNLYIGGAKPSSLDYDVYESLEGISFIPADLRYVRLWKSVMERTAEPRKEILSGGDQLLEQMLKLSISTQDA